MTRQWSPMQRCLIVLICGIITSCPTSCLAFESRSGRSTSAASPNSGVNVFLRLSPLIGGPKFLPLHLEVMLSGSSDRLHRFDFLPEKPTDSMTLARLLTLQSVPGLVRYRTFDTNVAASRSTDTNDESPMPAPGANGDTLSSLDELNVIARADSRIVRGRNGITLRLSNVAASDASAVITSAESFTQQYQEERGDLSLIRNSCFTYAYELVQFLDTCSKDDFR